MTTRPPTLHTWETVTSDPKELTERLRVVGGWVYRTSILGDDDQCTSTSATFVPDGKDEGPTEGSQ